MVWYLYPYCTVLPLHNPSQFHIMMISVAPVTHHLLQEKYDGNTSTATIVLTTTSSATIHPLGTIRFTVLPEIRHHFHHNNFVAWCP